MRVYFTSIFRRTTLVALLLALMGSAVQVTPVYAASIVVNSNADADANDGVCTLREAILAAVNTMPRHTAPGECAAGSDGADSISFVGNYTITVGSQLPFITTPITITGKGAANTIIQAAGSPNTATWRVFQVTPTGNLALEQVTVRNGRCEEFSCTVVGGIDPTAGGGIYNSGILTVINSTISGNSAFLFGIGGGGIYNRGTLTVTNSTFSGNSGGEGRGGGIHNKSGTVTVTNSTFSGNDASGIHNSGTLSVINSTFSGNTAYDGGGGISNSGIGTVTNSTFLGNNGADAGGGGIHNSGTLSVINSTFSGNTSYSGGGIYNSGTLTVTNSTFSGNNAYDNGGGISNSFTGILTVTNSTISVNISDYVGGGISNDYASTTILRNTIVANNSAENCYGTINNGGWNLDSGTSCGFGFNFDSLSNTDPLLGPLANNGGPTQTMKLLPGSPAIDKGNNTFCSGSPVNGADQRGVSRPQGWWCDIGAYEYNGTFWDVPLNYWAWDFIERLYAAGITGGCATSPLSYCPEGTVTRAQMAVFLLRGIHGASYAPPGVGAGTGFGDVPSSYWAATFIKQLAAEGITSGCGGGFFCPDQPVTRAQMAIFLLRSKHGAAYTPPGVGAGTGFGDVPPSYWAAAWIKQLVTEGITSGCGGGNYCPEQPVTRAQMAVFLVRTFNLP